MYTCIGKFIIYLSTLTHALLPIIASNIAVDYNNNCLRVNVFYNAVVFNLFPITTL